MILGAAGADAGAGDAVDPGQLSRRWRGKSLQMLVIFRLATDPPSRDPDIGIRDIGDVEREIGPVAAIGVASVVVSVAGPCHGRLEASARWSARKRCGGRFKWQRILVRRGAEERLQFHLNLRRTRGTRRGGSCGGATLPAAREEYASVPRPSPPSPTCSSIASSSSSCRSRPRCAPSASRCRRRHRRSQKPVAPLVRPLPETKRRRAEGSSTAIDHHASRNGGGERREATILMGKVRLSSSSKCSPREAGLLTTRRFPGFSLPSGRKRAPPGESGAKSGRRDGRCAGNAGRQAEAPRPRLGRPGVDPRGALKSAIGRPVSLTHKVQTILAAGGSSSCS